MPSEAYSAAGSVGGAIASGKAATKVAKIQQKTAQEQMAETRSYYNDAVTRYQPEITNGNNAEALYAGAIGNGDTAAADKAYAAFQGSTGYKTTYDNALASTNATAASMGLSRSGAALKALQDRAAYTAQQSYQGWLGDVNTQVQTGAAAKGALSGAASTALASNNAASTNAANASSNAALASGSATSTAFQNLGNLAANYASSYSTPGLSGVYSGIAGFGGSAPIEIYSNPDYSKG